MTKNPEATRPEFSGDLFDAGIAVRRATAGDRYVDAALSNANDFTADLQKLVTETAWGMVWTRPGLERKYRSMITVAMLAAMDRSTELKTHLRGAINNGVTRATRSRRSCFRPVSMRAFPQGWRGFAWPASCSRNSMPRP